jgi:hypothetical protein
MAFKQWTGGNKVPFDVNAKGPTDYDMRGFYRGQQQGDPRAVRSPDNGHFPDIWKTPDHATFSNESMFAKPGAPSWTGNQLISPGGRIVADEGRPPAQPFIPRPPDVHAPQQPQQWPPPSQPQSILDPLKTPIPQPTGDAKPDNLSWALTPPTGRADPAMPLSPFARPPGFPNAPPQATAQAPPQALAPPPRDMLFNPQLPTGFGESMPPTQLSQFYSPQPMMPVSMYNMPTSPTADTPTSPQNDFFASLQFAPAQQYLPASFDW